MPYKLVKRGNEWWILTKSSGRWKRKSKHKTRSKALSALRILYRVENEWNKKGR